VFIWILVCHIRPGGGDAESGVCDKKVLRSLDLRGNKWQETGENNIVRSFIIFPLLQTNLECSNLDGTHIFRVRGTV